MAPLAHTHPQVTLTGRRLRRTIALAVLAAMVAVAVVVALTLPGDTRDRAVSSGAPAAVSSPPPGARFDGGPDEGTRGAGASATPTAVTGARFDGGPDEGSRGRGR